jgi:hypothetical protein
MTDDKSIPMLTKAAHNTTLASLDRAIQVMKSDKTAQEKCARMDHIGCVIRRALDDLKPLVRKLRP